jgi:hypothetical protein
MASWKMVVGSFEQHLPCEVLFAEKALTAFSYCDKTLFLLKQLGGT